MCLCFSRSKITQIHFSQIHKMRFEYLGICVFGIAPFFQIPSYKLGPFGGLGGAKPVFFVVIVFNFFSCNG